MENYTGSDRLTEHALDALDGLPRPRGRPHFWHSVFECLLWHLIIGIPMTHPASLTEGKVLARRESRSGNTALVLNYPLNEAARLRDLVQSIRLRGDRKPSLSLIARRSMAVYLDHVASSHDALSDEIDALELLATPIATRKRTQPA